jgi:hypothetical protein
MTRELWLLIAVEKLKPLFSDNGYKLPEVRVSCGWPSTGGTSRKKRTIGQCWTTEAAKDGITQIFISPYLEDIAGEQGVLATLVHELVHAVVGVKNKHNKIFGKAARAVGLEGKLTATSASESLCQTLYAIAKDIGDYPHAQLDALLSPTKKQTTRMLKAECIQCGYTVRLAKKWLDEVGAPCCPNHGKMEIPEPNESKDN